MLNLEENSPLIVVQKFLNDYKLCKECIGRQFALLGTGYSNSIRAESLLNSLILQFQYLEKYSNSTQVGSENNSFDELLKNIAIKADFEPAKKLLNKIGVSFENKEEDFKCSLCDNAFLKTEQIIEKVIEKTVEFEFQNFLVGTVVDARIQDREDEFRVRYKISTGEALKKNMNRVIGIKLSEIMEKSVEFNSPELNINVILKKDEISIDIQSNPLCIEGNYRKYKRGIPQTHWPHRKCNGKGCKDCNFSGKQYDTSVEELLSPYFLKESQGNLTKFHGAGREDIDARCLGDGRPFIIEIKKPKKRNLQLTKIEREIKEEIGESVDVSKLRIVPRSEIKILKSAGEGTSKTYSVLIQSDIEIPKDEFHTKAQELEKSLIDHLIYQRTPNRVIHRRTDKTREKKVYDIKGVWIDNYHMRFKIVAMGGTYIKELISGDSGRTVPSFSSVFQKNLTCIELDVIEIQKPI
jgi:tRNA pseudouridine synthase 10